MLRSCFIALLLISAIPALAQPRANFAGPDQFICGTSTFMQADPLASGETGFWSVVQGTADFISPSAPNSGATGLSFGENVLRWTIIGSSGPSSDQVSIWCYNSTMPLADAGADQTVNHWPGTTQLNGSAPFAPGTCFWEVISGSAAVAEPNNPLTAIAGLGTGINVLQWNCDNGPCGSSSDQMVIDAVVGIAENSSPPLALRHDPLHQRLLFTPTSTAATIALFDGQGRMLHQRALPSGASSWSLPSVPSGIYLAHLHAGEASAVLRFSVSR
jgi:hypothetical protein